MEKRTGRRSELRAKHIAIAVAAAFAPWAHGQTPPPPNTLPHGGVITHGSGAINAPVHTPALSTLNIDQTSARMAARFGSFSIGERAHVKVTQPTSASIALFKDVSGRVSQIYGGLSANGQIFISNQNGVLIGRSGLVEAAGFVASTLSLNESEFMLGDSSFNWIKGRETGKVTNEGTIITPSGYAMLAGAQVRNDGVILARTGSVVLAAGDRVALDLIGDGLISVSVDQEALNASAINTGTINADGGTVTLTARSASALLDTVVNSGVIRATSLVERNGEIVLDAGASGTVYATGETQATHVSVRGGGLHVERLVPDPMFLNGMIAGDTVNVDVTDAVLVDRGGQIASRAGQSITAGSLTIRAQQPGEFSTVHNETGNQAITVTGADGIVVEATNGGGAILGKPFMFGVPATDSQTISATRIQVQGGSLQANEQNIIVSGDFSLQNGAASTLGGNQTITVAGGNVDLRSASISSGAAQSITVTGGDHISVVGEAGFAGLQASFGPQTVSISGTGANAINIDGATVNGLNQTITAGNPGESGSITITGSSNSNGFSHIANIGVGVANPQTVRTSGTLRITGGSARAAGIFQNNPAEQRISAASVVLQGGPSGSGNGAFINSTFGGGQHFNVPGEIRVTGGVGGAAGIFNGSNTPLPGTSTPQTNSAPQTIYAGSVVLQGAAGGSGNGAFINSTFGGNQTLTVPGEIRVTGGEGGTGNRAGISTNAHQTIAGNPNVVLTGGGGSGNNAFIQATGDETKLQVINARAITLAGGSGADASATLNAVRQNIATTTGDVSLIAGAGLNAGSRIGGLGGTVLGPTNLTLTVGGDLLLRGGAGDGVSLGSNAASTQANNITVNALSGDVILEAGTGGGARIGASGQAAVVNPGNISVTAGGSLEVGEGTGIRANGPITLMANSLTNDGTISNGGGANTATMILNANAFDLADGNIQGGAAAVALRPRAGNNSFGIEAAGATTLTNADIASIQTDNFIIFGSSTGTVFTGNMTIGENARVEGNGKNLAFSRSLTPSVEMITIGSRGVATSGDIIMGAGGGGIRSNGGTVTGDEVVLRASNGIGTPGARVMTAANALALNNAGGGGVFVSELDNVTLRTISLNAGGAFTVSNTNNGSVSLISGGDVNVAGLVSSGGSMILDAGGNLKLDATSVDAELRSFGGQTISAQSVSVTALNGRRAQVVNNGFGEQRVTAGSIEVETATGGGLAEIRNNSAGAQNLTVLGDHLSIKGLGGGTAAVFGGGNQTIDMVTGNRITLGDHAAQGQSLLSSNGHQTIQGNADLMLIGGSGPIANGSNAIISANNAGRMQTINARTLTMENSNIGGNSSVAAILGANQLITTTGDVVMTANASGGALPGVRIGGVGGGGAPATGTNLTLDVGRDLLMTGGTLAGNGVGIGSTAAQIAAPANNITINALNGNVILETRAPGAGVRIGSSITNIGTGQGNITITAGGDIRLNGAHETAAIRTRDTVTLNAANISEVGLGTIVAGTLNTHSSGSTLLTGMDAAFNINNAVSNFGGVSGGDLSFFNRGPLNVTGVNAAGNASVVNALADLNLTGQWTSSTASIFSGAAIVESGAGAIQAASLVADAPLGLNLAGANRVGVLDGKTFDVLTFNNVVPLEVARASASNGANLTSAGTMTISGPVTSSSSINLTANGGSIVETDTGSITTGAFGSLRTFSSGDTTLESFNNQVSLFNAASGGDIGLRTNGFLTVTTIDAAGTTEISAGDISLTSTVTSPQVLLNAGGSISQFGAASGVIADALATTSGGNTTLAGENRVASYSGTSGADLFFFNRGALNVSHLDAVNANLSNEGTIIISGPWSTSASTTIGASGFEGSLVEAAGGFIQSSGRTDLFAQQSIDLNGPNQITGYLSLFGMQGDVSATNTGDLTTFAGTATLGDLTFVNTGSLNVSGLSAMNASVTNHGPMTINGSWFSMGATSVVTEGPGSPLTVTGSVFSNGPMTVNVDGTLTVTASGVQTLPPPPGFPPFPPAPSFATLTSSGGQDISAESIQVVASDGAQAFINNQGAGNQNITVTGGGINVHAAGGPVVPGTIGSFAQIGNSGVGNQTLTASGGGGVQLRSTGGSAQISSGMPGSVTSQTINVIGGSGLEIEAQGGGNASINQTGAGAQRLLVTDADHIKLDGLSGSAIVFANGGVQEISITGSGSNTIRVGSVGASGGSQFVAGSQAVSAGSITIIGSDGAARTNGFITLNNPAAPGRTQSIETTGAITVVGGNAPFQFIPPPPQPQVLTSSNAGFFHNSNGAQTVSAGGITLQGGTGINNGVFINSTAGGNQTLTVAGELRVTGGNGGNANRAGIVTNANQTINGNPEIILKGGAGGGGGNNSNNVFIQATGPNTTQQTINARRIEVRAGAGTDASATINAAKQVITTLGDVSVFGSGGAGGSNGARIGGIGGNVLGATNLTLDVGGNLLVHGGSVNGASLGSSGASTQSNTITVTADGNITLESEGAGARIGTSGQVAVTSGNIAVTAAGSLQLGKGAIRTLDTVKLDAADISQGPSGLIIAGTLNTTTSGDTTLTGQNEVKVFNATSTGGDISLANTGALAVTAMSAFGDASINNVGNVTVTGPWSAGGTSLISAQSDIVLASLLTSPNVVLQASGSISEFGQNGVGAVMTNTLTTTSGGNTFFSGENRVASYSGTSGGDLFFFNRGDLDVSGVHASMAALSNNGAVTISGPWITSGQTNITAVGGPGATLSESAGGFIQATGFNGLSADGSVNLNGPNRISGNLFGHSMQGDFSLNNAGDLSFGSAAFSGDLHLVNAGALNVTSLSGRNVAVTNAGAMTVSGFWNSMGTTAITTTGAASDLTVSNTVTSQGAMTINVDGALTVAASGVQVIPPPAPGLPPMPPVPPIPQFASLNSSGGQDITAKSVRVSANDGAVATINNQIAGGQTLRVSGGGIDVRTSGGAPSGPGSSNAQITNFGAGNQSFTVSGPAGVNVAANGGFAAIINNSASSQAIEVTGGTGVDVHAAGGFALISNGAGTQNISVSGGKGIDVVSTGATASIQTFGGAQAIVVTNADHVNVNGIAGQASISGGMQTLSITGDGANALAVGSQGATGSSFIGGFGQSLTAGAPGQRGSIRIFGTDTPDRFVGIGNSSGQGIAPREQNISVAGTLAVTGGSAAGQFIPPAPRPPVLTTSNAGIFNNANASQIINAGRVEVRGGASGLNNGTFISSGAGGNQAITVNGGVISIAGGDGGSNNRAGITSTGNQTINGNPDILLAGGTGGSANNAFIQATGSNSLQAIYARNVQLHAGTGIDASSTLNAARQVISTSGDVSLVGSGGAGTLNGVRIGGLGATLGSTNLTLDVGGNLLLHGGTASGVSLGSSAPSTQSNNITVTAAGDVTLESEGAGARIGTSGQVPVTSGEIVITAGGNVHLGNGTAIRTSDNVSLHADQPGGTISQGTNGLILANSLGTSSHGSTSLIGSNQVASLTASSAQGDVHLTNSKPVLTLGSMDLPGNLTIVQTGNLAVGSASAEQSTVVSAAGDISLSASGQILVRGSDTTPGSFAQITSHGSMDISAAGNVTLVGGSADGAFARILGYSDINLTVGGFITLDAGSGVDAWARIQTASPNSVITLNFPNLASGGYFVNGMELLSDGPTGFLSGNGVVAPGQVITIYGAP